jgi:hypothetical protein
MHPPIPDPLPYTTATPDPRRKAPSADAVVARVLLSALLFAAGHWITELATAHILTSQWFRAALPATTPDFSLFDLCIESLYACGEFFLLILAQTVGILVTGEANNPRGLPFAAALGIVYSLARWTAWFFLLRAGIHPSNAANLLEALVLTTLAGALLAWRHSPRRSRLP